MPLRFGSLRCEINTQVGAVPPVACQYAYFPPDADGFADGKSDLLFMLKHMSHSTLEKSFPQK
jgi:hypothetical protein